MCATGNYIQYLVIYNGKQSGKKYMYGGFPGGSVVRNPPANAGDVDSIPDLERSLGKENDNPLPYSCLKNHHGQRNL